MTSLCVFPIFDFNFVLPLPIPVIPIPKFPSLPSISLFCPLD